MRWLLIAEWTAVVGFVAIATVSFAPKSEALQPINVAALKPGPAEETWNGIFIGEAHIGYSVSRESALDNGGRLFEQRANFTIGAMGSSQQVLTAGTAITDEAGRLVQFDFLLSAPVLLVGHGEVRPGSVHVELQQDGEESVIDVPIAEAPSLSLTATSVIRGKEVKPGDVFEMPYFDPISMSQSTMKVTVEAPEMLANGEVAWWLRMNTGGIETRRLVDPQGATLREESALGLRSVRMTKDEAVAVDAGEPPDLVALAAVPIQGTIDASRPLTLKVSGVPAAKFVEDAPLQHIEGDTITVTVPPVSTWPVLPVQSVDPGDTEPTPSLPSTHADIVAKSRQVVGDAPDRAEAARRIHEFVYSYVAKVPTIGIPNGLEVLHSGKGDCNEHTALFVSLARAAGIPSRIAAGLVYSQRLDHAFYYHAWPEVRLGPNESWVPLDPTLGQFPADASHLKIVTGDLDRQLEIMSVMGKISLTVAASPAVATPADGAGG